MKNIFLALFSMATSFAYAQSPVLVSDYNPGEASAFESTRVDAVELNGAIILPLTHEDTGEELGIIKDGVLSLLKDIKPGPEDSDISQLTLFNELVYFTADDGDIGWAIWQTDGTPEGTVLAYSPLSNTPYQPRGYTVSASGKMYYTFNNKLYVFDGTDHTSIHDGVRFSTSSSPQYKRQVAYKNEIAFLAESNNNEVELYKVENDEAVFLAKIENVSGFPNFYGLTALSDGLLFGLEDTFEPDVEGTYFYNETTSTLNRFIIGGEPRTALRIVKYSDTQVLALILDVGYVLLNGSDNMEVMLYDTDPSTVQGQPIENAIYEDKMIFDVNTGFFGDDFLVYYGGGSSGAYNLFEVTYPSSILTDGESAYIADKTSNGFDPILYKVDINLGSYEILHAFSDPSSNSDSVHPLGIQGNKLFLLINLDGSVGRELYYYALGPIDNTTEEEQLEFEVVLTSNTFQIIHEKHQLAQVNIYDTAGRLMEKVNTTTNTTVDISHLNGMQLLEFVVDGKRLTKKFYR